MSIALRPLLFATFLFTPFTALADELTDFGTGLCLMAADGEIPGFDAAEIVSLAEAYWPDRNAWCGCVGTAFSVNMAEQSAAIEAASEEESADIMAQILRENMSVCANAPEITGGEHAGSGADDGGDVTDGDLVGFDPFADGSFPADPGDLHICGLMLDDAFPAPGFRADEVLAQMTGKGLTRDALCGCAGSWLAVKGESLDEAIEGADQPSREIGQWMSVAIGECLEVM